MQEKFHGGLCGFLFGMYLDIINGRVIGISAVCLCISGSFSEFVNKNISNDNKFTIILMIAVNTFLYEFLSYIFSIWKLSVNPEFLAFLKIIIVEILFNSILIIILYPVIQIFRDFLYNIFENKKKYKYI